MKCKIARSKKLSKFFFVAPCLLALVLAVGCEQPHQPITKEDSAYIEAKQLAKKAKAQIRIKIHTDNVAINPDDAGDIGMVGDQLRLDVEGPSFLGGVGGGLSGDATFKDATGAKMDFVLDSSLLGDDKIEFFDSTVSASNPVITLELNGFDQGQPRVFVHLNGGSSIFTATLDKLSVDIAVDYK